MSSFRQTCIAMGATVLWADFTGTGPYIDEVAGLVMTNTGSPVSEAGPFGTGANCLRFPTVNDYATVPDNNLLDWTTGTIVVVLRRDADTNAWQSFVDKGNGGHAVSIHETEDKLTLGKSGVNTLVKESGTTPAGSSWVTYGGSHSGAGTGKVHKNGVDVSSGVEGTLSLSATATVLTIGRGPGGTERCAGSIAGIAYFPTVLSTSDHLTIHNSVPNDDSVIQLVQSKNTIAHNPNVTLDASPTDGNLLLIFAARRDGTTIPIPDGWNLTPEGYFDIVGGRGCALFWKESDGTESSVALTGNIAANYAEFSGVDVSSVLDSSLSTEVDNGTYEGGGDIVPGSASEILIYGGDLGDTFGMATTPTNSTLELADMQAPAGEKPGVWVAYKIISSPSGNQKITGTGTSTPHQGTTIAFAATSESGPVWVSPADGVGITSTPVLVFDTEPSSRALHAHLQLDKVNTFNGPDLRNLHTLLDQTGWEYYDAGWNPFPATGMPVAATGNQVRYTVQTPLTAGTWYRRVRVG